MTSIEEILKMASDAQAGMEKAQAALDRVEVEGTSGGGLVKVVASAKGRIVKLEIDPSLLTPDSKEMTEDLVVAAFNDARAKADQAAQAMMREMMSGLPLPPGFKF
ncbi:MAG: YbaB/EbfC family nucleoid-associated protein [Sphingomonadaceae bacterium]